MSEPGFTYQWSSSDLLGKCEPCEGTGYVSAVFPDTPARQERACKRCRGSGVVPTPAGNDILSLLAWERIFSERHDA
jgi:hypothetical protein